VASSELMKCIYRVLNAACFREGWGVVGTRGAVYVGTHIILLILPHVKEDMNNYSFRACSV
jgi:hypothetical protein